MTNIGREHLRNALDQNHSFRGSACDTSPLLPADGLRFV